MQYALIESGLLYPVVRWSPEHSPEYGTPRDTSTYPVWRRKMLQVVCSRTVQIIWGAAVCLSVGLGLAEQPLYDLGRGTYVVFFTLQTICLAFFWFRMLADMIASGLDYVKRPCNWIELAVNVFGILQLIPPTQHIRWIRAWSAARPLRHLLALPPLTHHWKAIVHSTLLTTDIYFIGICMLFFFATIAVNTFGDVLEKRCVVTSISASSPSQFQNLTLPYTLDGDSSSLVRPCGVGRSCPSFNGTSVACEVVSVSRTRGRFYHFRNVGTSLLVVLKVASADQWHGDLDALMSAGGAGSALFYVAAVVCLFPISCCVIAAVFRFYTRCASGSDTLGSSAPRKVKSTQTEERCFTSSSVPSPTRLENRSTPKASQKTYYVDVDHPSSVWCTLAVVDRKAFRGISGRPLTHYQVVAVRVLQHATFVIAELFFSLVSVVLLAVLYETMDAHKQRCIMITSCAVSLVFLVRVFFYGSAFGIRALAKDLFFYTDVAGAAVGIIELAGPHLFTYGVIRGLRCLRVLHFLKYAPCFLPLHSLCKDLGMLLFLLVSIQLLYALCGMELFGNYLRAADTFPRGNFSTMWNALLLTFTIFTGSNWYASLLALFGSGTVPTGVLFVLSLLGWNYVVFVPLTYSIILYRTRQACYRALRAKEQRLELSASHSVPPLMEFCLTQGASFGDEKKDLIVTHKAREHGEPVIGECYTDENKSITKVHICGILSFSLQRFFTVAGSSFWFIPPRNLLRKWLILFFQSFFYQIVSFLMVAMNTVTLFLERKQFDGRREVVLNRLNIACVVIFWSEMVLKWFTYGLFIMEDTANPFTASLQIKPYFRVPINYFDLVANGLSFAGLFYKPLRVGRVARTVRLLTTQERPNAYLGVLSRSLPHSLKAFPVIMACYVWFALLGAQFFSGRLRVCSDATTFIANESLCVGVYNATSAMWYNGSSSGTVVTVQNRQWIRATFNYDHFGQSLLSVFAFTTTGDWTPFMYDGASSRAGTLSSWPFHSGYYVAYFVVALLVFRFYLFYLVAGALVTPFSYYKNQVRKTKELTLEQIAFENTLCGLQHLSAIRSQMRPLRGKLCRLVHGMLSKEVGCGVRGVDVIVFVYHLVNCGFIAASHVSQPSWLHTTVKVLNFVSIGLCGLEVLLHLIAYGWVALCRVRVLFTLVLLALMIVAACATPLHFLQSVRFLKLLASGSFLCTLAPAQTRFFYLFNAVCLYLMLLLTYSVVGTLMFGFAQPSTNIAATGISDKQNFSTVIGSFLILVDCSSLDSWEHLMTSLYSVSGSGTYAAVVYFVTFIVFSRLVLIQLIVVCLLDIFSGQVDFEALLQCAQLRRTWTALAGSNSRIPLGTLSPLIKLLAAFNKEDKLRGQHMISSLARIPVGEDWSVSYGDFLRVWCGNRFQVQWPRCRQAAMRRKTPALTLYSRFAFPATADSASNDTTVPSSKKKSIALTLPVHTGGEPAAGGATGTEGGGLRSAEAIAMRGLPTVPEANMFLFDFLEEGTGLVPGTPPLPPPPTAAAPSTTPTSTVAGGQPGSTTATASVKKSNSAKPKSKSV